MALSMRGAYRDDVSRATRRYRPSCRPQHPAAPAGTATAIARVACDARDEGVHWVRIYRRPGWRFGPLLRGADRAGAVLAAGASREEALERARRAAQAVRFHVDADPA